jgi:hypothetical protein
LKGLINVMNRSGSTPLNPATIWRWGFTLALVGVGIWLVIANPAVGSANGKLLGWIVIAYGVIRLLLNRLVYPARGRRGLHR